MKVHDQQLLWSSDTQQIKGARDYHNAHREKMENERKSEKESAEVLK